MKWSLGYSDGSIYKCSKCPFITHREDIMIDHWDWNHTPPKLPKKDGIARLRQAAKERSKK